MNEQVIAKLRALKAEPGMQMHWQERIDAIIADLSAPVAPVVPPPAPPTATVMPAKEPEQPKAKVTTAASISKPAVTTPAKTKGK